MHGPVMGFMGTGPVTFVGERPSTGNFGGTAPVVQLFYGPAEAGPFKCPSLRL
jgi:hypothetical protein